MKDAMANKFAKNLEDAIAHDKHSTCKRHLQPRRGVKRHKDSAWQPANNGTKIEPLLYEENMGNSL